MLVIGLSLVGLVTGGFMSRLVSGAVEPVEISVVFLLGLALVLAATYAATGRLNLSAIPVRRFPWFYLLGIFAGLVAWLIGVGIPGFKVLADGFNWVSLTVLFLLVGHERRRMDRQEDAAR